MNEFERLNHEVEKLKEGARGMMWSIAIQWVAIMALLYDYSQRH